MKPATLTPDLSKRARRELGLSQTDVIKATGIQAYKLKQWEGRGLTIELADIRKLTDFYESQNVDLAELAAHMGQASRDTRADSTAEEPAARHALQDGFTYTPRPGFIISDQLPAELVDSLMERMETNDDRIAKLTAEAFSTGFFGNISDATETNVRELFGALAENYTVFRFLQGRNIIAPTRDEAATIGDYLSQWMRDESDVAELIVPGFEAKGSSQRPKQSGVRTAKRNTPQAAEIQVNTEAGA